jgi:hypothetical protein
MSTQPKPEQKKPAAQTIVGGCAKAKMSQILTAPKPPKKD